MRLRAFTILGLAILIALTAFPGQVHAATFIVNKTADTNDGACDADCSLREAIIAANALAGVDTITVPAGTYILTIAGTSDDASETGDLDIADDLTIIGAGPSITIIDGGGLERVIEILPGSLVNISGVTIQNGNDSGMGGGIFNAGTLTLINSAVSNNTAEFLGGGIGNFGAGSLTLDRSTVSGNTSGAPTGGGISNNGDTVSLIAINSTVSGNSSGISNNGSGGTIMLTNVTVSGSIFAFAGSVTLVNTIITNPGGTACISVPGATFTSGGHNLASDETCGLTEPTDLPNTDPLIGPLRNNSGPTKTHSLAPGSPAIDAGDDNAAPPTDQRGVIRPQNAASDIGAYEVAPCQLDMTLDYADGTLTMDFDVGTAEPALWVTWLFILGFPAFPIWSEPLEAIDPPEHFEVSIPDFPSLGKVWFLTVLATSEGVTCFDSESVDTGTSPSFMPSVSELREVTSGPSMAVPIN